MLAGFHVYSLYLPYEYTALLINKHPLIEQIFVAFYDTDKFFTFVQKKIKKFVDTLSLGFLSNSKEPCQLSTHYSFVISEAIDGGFLYYYNYYLIIHIFIAIV